MESDAPQLLKYQETETSIEVSEYYRVGRNTYCDNCGLHLLKRIYNNGMVIPCCQCLNCYPMD